MTLFSSSPTEAKRLQDINGHSYSWSDLRGKWVFINYWASWCEPCLQEISELNRFYEKTKTNNVALFAVNYDGLTLVEQKNLIAKLHIRYPSLKEDPKDMLQLSDISVLPVTFVFDPYGQLVETLYGGQSTNNLMKSMKNSQVR